MSGFIRRYGYFPGTETITLIEGVVVVDLPPPGSVQGVGVGTVGLVGEFLDVSSAVSVSSSTGAVSDNPIPVEIFSAQDMIDKVGGFDPTLGKFGAEMGNGFVALRNKTFSRLVLQAINLASPQGVRMWRTLPTNAGATNPNPAVPMQAVAIAAGTEFRSGVNRARTAQRVVFTDDANYAAGIDGVALVASGTGTQNFSAAGANFLTLGVKVGDAVVIGTLPAAGVSPAGAQQINANTYRVNAIVDANNLTLERQDGSNFIAGNWIAGVALVWRLHLAKTADTGNGNILTGVGGYVVPARPLDASIAQATLCSPALTPPTPSATSWDPLSGLQMQTHPTAPGLAYTATVQAPNAANDATIDALYVKAIDGFLSQELPAREVSIMISARSSDNIRTKLKSHVLTASQQGTGRVAIISPSLSTQALATVIGDAAPGVGALRDESVFYSWPGVRTFIPEAVNISIAAASGPATTDGIIDTMGAEWLAAVCSNLPPERNPGQAGSPVPTVLAPVIGIQRGVSGLQMADYIALRAKGVCALRMDRTVGPIFQSGVTSSLISGQKNINRRRFAYFFEDSLAQRLVQFAKLPLTRGLQDVAVGETVAFCDELLSPNNPAAQRIDDYIVDPKSGNTPGMKAKGIFVIITRIKMTPTADFFVVQSEIGEGVVITRS